MNEAPERARALLDRARSVAVLTGAGISAESGVPTFRGGAGLWRSHRPEELATPEAFRRDPGLVWTWYRWRRGLVGGCQPNAGHAALARFALSRGNVDLVTQNVDGLHHRAAVGEAGAADPGPGLPTELHGSLLRDRCSGCGHRSEAEIPASDEAGLLAEEAPSQARMPPRCVRCDELVRPDVVWFGEALDPSNLEHAFRAAAAADACLVVGTSSLVYPAAGVPRAALEAGRPLVEVNLEPTPLTPHATIAIQGGAADILPDILGS